MLATLVVAALLTSAPAPAYAVAPDSPLAAYSSGGYSKLCVGYSSCANTGHSNSGYATARGSMYWRMYAGHNCTNYVAYRMVRAGMPNVRPWSGSGNATNWGSAMRNVTDATPRVGAVAWWRAYARPAGSAGHVAYVERVISSNEIIVSQDSWGGDFSWARITRSSGYWPSGFVHFRDVRPEPETLRNTVPPSVRGTPEVGQTLTARPGAWNLPGTRFTYQWRTGKGRLDGETSPTITLDPALAGRRLRVRVWAHHAGTDTVNMLSSRTKPVARAPLALDAPASLTGTARLGQLLTVTHGLPTPSDATVVIQWLRGGEPVEGATAPTYKLGLADLGSQMAAEVTVSRPGYTTLVQRTRQTNRVRTVPVVSATLVPAARQLRVKMAVTSTGVSPVKGTVAVRRDDTLVGTMTLRNGVAETVFTGLVPGRGEFVIRYRGSDRVARGLVTQIVTIPSNSSAPRALGATRPTSSPGPTSTATPQGSAR